MKAIKIPEVSKADLKYSLTIKLTLRGGFTRNIFFRAGHWGPSQEVWVDNETEILEFFFKSGSKTQRT